MRRLGGNAIIGIGILIAGGSFGLCVATMNGPVIPGVYDWSVFVATFLIGIGFILAGAFGSPPNKGGDDDAA